VSVILVSHLVSVSAYAGFQWTVHLVVYPQLGEVPAASFAGYERWHQRRISRVVGPLFALLVATTALMCVWPPPGAPWEAPVAAVLLLAVILAATGLLAVPMHRRLSRGWDESAHRRLTAVDAVRVAAATANVAVAAVLALG
jgi:hypothetical protein